MKHTSSDCLVICISPGVHGRWDVSGKGSIYPFASFAQREQACAYANELALRVGDATILVEERDGFAPLPITPFTRPTDVTGDQWSQT